jgi:hypothetical protein
VVLAADLSSWFSWLVPVDPQAPYHTQQDPNERKNRQEMNQATKRKGVRQTYSPENYE